MLGTDIVLISRIAEALKKPNFIKKILLESETLYAMGKSKEITRWGFDSVSMTVAGLFAAKEAVLKALNVGMKGGYGFKDIEIYHSSQGAPLVRLSTRLNKVLINKGKKEVNISIAHDGEYAIAMAILS